MATAIESPRVALMTADERRVAAAFLDLQEGRGPFQLLDDDGIAAVLRETRRIAVIGASPHLGRPSHSVFQYLRRVAYDVVPIHPSADAVDGVTAYPSLSAAVDATGTFDLVDVFRRSEACVPHAIEAVAAGARCLWLQLGVVNWEAARIAADGGLGVVMDRCTMVEHHRHARP